VALLKLSIDGNSYEYDPDTITLREGMELENSTNQTVDQFVKGLSEGKAKAFLSLFWLARKRNGEDKLKFSDVDGSYASINVETVEAETPEVPTQEG
jgi:hypothetical protein